MSQAFSIIMSQKRITFKPLAACHSFHCHAIQTMTDDLFHIITPFLFLCLSVLLHQYMYCKCQYCINILIYKYWVYLILCELIIHLQYSMGPYCQDRDNTESKKRSTIQLAGHEVIGVSCSSIQDILTHCIVFRSHRPCIYQCHDSLSSTCGIQAGTGQIQSSRASFGLFGAARMMPVSHLPPDNCWFSHRAFPGPFLTSPDSSSYISSHWYAISHPLGLMTLVFLSSKTFKKLSL